MTRPAEWPALVREHGPTYDTDHDPAQGPDPRFITVRRGGSLEDDDHRLLAVWAADCAEHVLHHFERARPGDDRPRRAIELGRAWARGEVTWARPGRRPAMPTPRPGTCAELRGMPRTPPARPRRWATWRPTSSAPRPMRSGRRGRQRPRRGDEAGRRECRWQRAQLPDAIRELVLDDQRLRNELCWFAFDC